MSNPANRAASAARRAPMPATGPVAGLADPGHPQVVLARELARVQHTGQVDAEDRDYFAFHLTPIAELLRPYGPLAEAVGWLHDIVEDTDTTADDLLDAGVADDVVDDVVAVSRVPGEPYTNLTARAATRRRAALGKLADNSWNIACNHQLARTDPKRAASLLLGRYLPARPELIDGAGMTQREADALLERAAEIAARLDQGRTHDGHQS